MPSINQSSPLKWRDDEVVRGHEYYKDFDDRLHRTDGPAVLYNDGGREWWIHGVKHRHGAPAVIFPGGREEWWNYGTRHRDGGPAITETAAILEEWYFHGVLHREYGPAMKTQLYEKWFWHGQEHRDDGPACEYTNGEEEWFWYGKWHRDDGPAITMDDRIGWFFHGQLHRIDGPAIIDPMGFNKPAWYIFGVLARDSDHFRRLARLSNEAMTILTLKYGEIKT